MAMAKNPPLPLLLPTFRYFAHKISWIALPHLAQHLPPGININIKRPTLILYFSAYCPPTSHLLGVLRNNTLGGRRRFFQQQKNQRSPFRNNPRSVDASAATSPLHPPPLPPTPTLLLIPTLPKLIIQHPKRKTAVTVAILKRRTTQILQQQCTIPEI